MRLVCPQMEPAEGPVSEGHSRVAHSGEPGSGRRSGAAALQPETYPHNTLWGDA